MKPLPFLVFGGLMKLPQFIVYALSPSKNRLGKTDKFPIDPITGYKINHLDPKNQMTYEQAQVFVEQHRVGHGVGFVFTKQDPYWVLDIDDCLIAGKWTPVAESLMQQFTGAAMEISNSGKGIHIIGRGNSPVHKCKNKLLGLEFYTTSRFIALTGNNAIGNVDTDFSDSLITLVTEYFPTDNSIGVPAGEVFNWTTEPCQEWNGPKEDTVLINRALNSQSAKAAFGTHASFKNLWDGDFEILNQVYCDQNGVPDDSSFDAALALHLAFWTGNNCERIKTLMLQSKLVREKWNRPDYLRRTIINACVKQTKWLCDKQPEPNQLNLSQAKLVDGTTYLALDQQMDLFKGCVYICDIHKILIPGGHLLRPEQFRAMFGGYTFPMDTNNEKVSRNAWEVFTESQAIRFPRADGSCFRPELPPATMIEDNGRVLTNLWWPIITPRKVGDVTPFLTHLSKLLPNSRDQLILLCFFAACVQYKGTKFQWAPVIQGVEGNGKTLLTRCVAFAIGDIYTHTPRADQITTRFNDWMYKRLLICVDDMYVPDSQIETYEALKPMITNNRLEIEAKNGTKITLGVCCNFIINTNHKDGLRKNKNDRRFALFYTAQQAASDLIRDGMDSNYYSDLLDWLNFRDGFAIVSEFLHSYKIPDEFNPATQCRRAPHTSSTDAAITHGLSNLEQEITEAIEQEIVGFKNGWVSSMALDRLLDKLYMSKRFSHNKRKELLQSLGYDWHPALPFGRVNNTVLPDGGKPRLFVKKGHPSLALTNPVDVAKSYTNDQNLL